MQNLMEGLLQEMNRVREIIKNYEHPDLKGTGVFAASMMKMDIKNAENSIATGNTISMIICYKKLKEYES